METGYTTMMYDESAALDGIADIGACRYDAVEMGLEKLRAVGPDAVAASLAEHDLDLSLVMGEWLESDAAADRVAEGARLAGEVGAPFVGILPPQRGHVEDATLDGWLATVCEAAADADVTPVLHHHGGTHVEGPDEIAAWLDRGPDNLRLLWDTAHYYPYGGHYPAGDVTDGLDRFGDDVAYVHLKDVLPPVDFADHVEALTAAEFHLDNVINYFRAFTDLGEGVLDFGGVRDALDRVGYDGYAVIEIENRTMDPLVHAKRNLDHWRASGAESG